MHVKAFCKCENIQTAYILFRKLKPLLSIIHLVMGIQRLTYRLFYPQGYCYQTEKICILPKQLKFSVKAAAIDS